MRIAPGPSLLATVFLAGLASPPVFAADAPSPLWHKTCAQDGNKASCVVEQFALAQPNNVPVLQVRFDLQGGDGKARVILTAPLGVRLPPGLQLAVDSSDPFTLPYDHCLQRGCEAVAVLDTVARGQFEKGKTLTVRYTPPTQNPTPLAIPIKLEGLADALTSLSK